jgi:hypothetical protein
MHLSPFFHQLRSAYVAEIEDMSHDSDGAFILQQRLKERRSELQFLVTMLELSPEMVAVVLHKAFVFNKPQAMHQVLGCEPEDLPDWDSLDQAVTVASWAQPLVRTIRAQAAGDWFMTVAAAAEFMLAMPGAQAAASDSDDQDDQDDHDAEHGDEADHLSADDDIGPGSAQEREAAGADWMADQGFDRKD